ncbi:hypothetical protein EV361DRAFT_960471 [Lentinula raphanica]|uniref:Semialdehyde dehydrogenase NAD-binding domain-containing protein n=1 Tax=Lentinula raphanica TaxID=153919 RepID=A0AA38PIV9_9AGAR|nr:aspartate-semialdehyde dehydrogenase [Lentinula raphanica]KAJ3770939.1 hypothetical protein FB446DRAFT_742235 [Lentinula raphanica]KAJ3830438.1 hypothetical protein F5880DRAFT_1606743 [Lentinula raphanica]KAJ3843709.1 hypothetical protein F5878DRAFT_715031 [Lentinula raphanica]KAJ3974151.1 hypothetical protein EV361DRAFT_960471 [Lentinula raphanica]
MSSKITPHTVSPPKKIRVGVLGATGTVGQRFITLLSDHPWFIIEALGASERSEGKKYREAVKWKQTIPLGGLGLGGIGTSETEKINSTDLRTDDGRVADLIVKACVPENFRNCQLVFSGLDADVAGDIESAFRAANIPLFSNAKNYRRDPHVPLIVPLVNPSHFSIISQQQRLQSPPLSKGFIVTNANCSTTGYVIPLAALEKAFGPIESVLVTTMQAISGAGYPGVPSLDILGNVVPYIGGEEEKIEWETLKILGGIIDSETESDKNGTPLKTFDMHQAGGQPALRVSASCNRVPVIDGHMECVSLRFHRRPPPSPQQVREALSAFTPEVQALGCPSAPRKAIEVFEEPDRPQPRLDVKGSHNGAGVSVGRVRQCQVLDIKFVVLSDNVSIGAATSSIINAEYAVLKGVVS